MIPTFQKYGTFVRVDWVPLACCSIRRTL